MNGRIAGYAIAWLVVILIASGIVALILLVWTWIIEQVLV